MAFLARHVLRPSVRQQLQPDISQVQRTQRCFHLPSALRSSSTASHQRQQLHQQGRSSNDPAVTAAYRSMATTTSSGPGSSSSNGGIGDFSPHCHLRLLSEEARCLFPEAVPLASTEVPLRCSSSSNSRTHGSTASNSSSKEEVWYFLLHGILGGRRNLRSLALGMIASETAAHGVSRAFCFDLRGHGCSGRGALRIHLMARDLYAQIYLLLREEAAKRGLHPSSVSTHLFTSGSRKVLPPHGEGVQHVQALAKALGIRLVLIGHSMGGLVCMQTALDALDSSLFKALVVLDIAPSPYLLHPQAVAQSVSSKETTSIFVPSAASTVTTTDAATPSSSSDSTSSSSECCLDVGRMVPPPREGAYSSAALVGILLDLPLPLFTSKAAAAKALQQLQPPVKPAVLQWLLLSLTTETHREAELKHLLREQVHVGNAERMSQGVVLPSETDPQDHESLKQHLQQPQLQQQQEQQTERLMWHLDLHHLGALVSRNRSLGLSAAPLSVHDPQQSLSEGHREPYKAPTLFIRGSQSPWLDYKLQGPAIQRHFPGAVLREVAQAGHWLHAQQPQKTQQVIQEFLQSI
ncbi:uncharacterized protein LOC34617899 [Cyclospora cayetanensis]|uniref:Uncharacterized protein LOC34617899 n=1 Tax=Cyclospora cayetanensis TaxID=88456 RepID=A0A6P6S422_9EIME|nr:uncharacterized protein LOC34617899 [Cyclospora cayetanensis]